MICQYHKNIAMYMGIWVIPSLIMTSFVYTMHGFNLKRGPKADESWQMIIDHLKKYL